MFLSFGEKFLSTLKNIPQWSVDSSLSNFCKAKILKNYSKVFNEELIFSPISLVILSYFYKTIQDEAISIFTIYRIINLSGFFSGKVPGATQAGSRNCSGPNAL
ncbi:hypothetical protein GCM10008086_00930 [Salegentibacter mishustinae]|jgi:hypothetical protein|nr:hypothetical protein GCM10008086_00930 [Salegentibacter mishustinae]